MVSLSHFTSQLWSVFFIENAIVWVLNKDDTLLFHPPFLSYESLDCTIVQSNIVKISVTLKIGQNI